MSFSSPAATASTTDLPTVTLGAKNASDNFSRVVNSGLGTAEMGGDWSFRTNQKGAVAQVTGRESVLGPLSGGGELRAWLPSVSSADEYAQLTFSISALPTASAGYHVYLATRLQANQTSTAARVKIEPDGSVYLDAVTISSGSVTALPGAVLLPGKIAAGESYTLAMRSLGSAPTHVMATAWPTASGSADWLVDATTTDRSVSAISGSVGVIALNNDARPITLHVDAIYGWPTSGAPVGAPSPTAPAPAPAPVTTSTPAAVHTALFSANFDSEPLGVVNPPSFAKEFGGGISTWAPNYQATSIAQNPGGSGRAVQIYLQKGTILSNPAGSIHGIALPVQLPRSYDAACLSYDVMFDKNFDFSEGGKLPGLDGVAPGVNPTSPTGGHPTSQGWSGRLMWLGAKTASWAGTSNTVVSYMYHPGQSSEYGDGVRWNRPFTVGQWNHVKICYTMNTVGKSDGVLQAWIGGQQTLDITNFVYRTRADVHINYLLLDVFRGGDSLAWAGSHDDNVYLDNMMVTAQ